MTKQLDTIDENRRLLSCILSFITSLLITVILLYLFSICYKPEVDMSAIRQIFYKDFERFRPEPIEQALFISGIIIMPVCLFLFQCLFVRVIGKVKNYDNLKIFNQILTFGLLVFLLWIGVAGMRKDNLFFLKNSIGFSPLSLFLILSLTAALYVMVINKQKNQIIVRYIELLLNLLAAVVIISIIFYNIYGINALYISFDINHHFNAVFHAVSQVYLGKEILVDLPHQYGLYPHFLNPLFYLIGLSVLKFTIVMGVLIGFSVYLIYRTMKERCGHKIIALLGFFTYIYFCYYFEKIQYYDPYFQYFPIRTLFPSIMIYLVHIYTQKRNILLYYFAFLISAIAIFWNLDSGIVVFFSWLLMLIFDEVVNKNYKNIISHFITALLSFLLVLSLFTLALFVTYGYVPDYMGALVYQNIFVRYGLMMLPMKLIHPWNLILLIYAVGIIYTLLSRADKSITSFVFFLSILGTGIFSYFVGRSHDLNLGKVSFPSVIIFTILTDRLLSKVRGHYYAQRQFLLITAILFFVFSFASLMKNSATIASNIFHMIHDTFAEKKSLINRSAVFLKRNLESGEEVLILSNLSGIYYLETLITNPLDVPGPAEMLLFKDLEKIESYIKNLPVGRKIVIDLSWDYFWKFPYYKDWGYEFESFSPDKNIAILKKYI